MKRRRKQLAELVGAHMALAVMANQCSVRDVCVGLTKDDRVRARELVEQLHQEAGR